MAAAAAEAAAAEAKAKAAAAEAAAAEAKAKAAAAKAEEARLAAERRSKEARVEVLRAELLAAERELEAEQEPQAAAAPEERSTPAFVFDDEEEGADDGGLGLELDVGGGLAAEAPEAAPQTAAVASQGKANPWDVEFDPDEEDPEDDEGWSDVVIESDVGFSAPSGGAEEVYRVGRGWAQGTNALAADFEEDLPAVGQTYVSGLSAQIEGAMKTRQTRTLRRERKAARREGGDASDKHAAALKGMYGGGDVAAANAIVLTPEELAARAAAGEAGGSAAADSDLAPPKRSVLKVLKIAGGCRTNLKLHSPDGDGTRPMMEKVRVAMFQMIASHMDSPAGVGALPGGRWLDLYAGTGAIGLEAISRGAESAHFCELDPWVVKKCLRRNAKTARFEDRATVHVTRVEDLLRRAAAHPASMGGAFEYMTVCPPYQKCSYPELFGLLEDTPLLTDASYVVVEYPGRLRRHVPDTLRNGALEKFRDRRYGRTWLAIWGPKGRARRVDGEGDSGRARRGAGAAGADKAREPIVIESDGPLPGGYGSRFAKGGAWSNDPDEVVIEG
uniref:Uncharacterized protein n=1 Tax=Prasinoderma singulare TaxID=676789 RepID=A0A7S3F4Y4_9VIRI|mmetsp:Transcript_11786/g.36436  ORF Transcript_11786/g.36436 Transcript_11786/m.36436 type:complete len:559 (+) Transcript_11786:3-1679(+)